MLRAEDIERVAVIGAGVMGSGIAQTFAQSGYIVHLSARREATLQTALERISVNQETMVQAGLLAETSARDARARIRPTTDLAEAVRGCYFISESVPEDLTLKREVFTALDREAPPGAVLTTVTSGLSVSAIAAATARPEVVVGFHWMNPPHLMPPVEVIRGEHTADETMDLVCAVAARIGRVPIRVEKDVPGFLWNRLQLALIREALHIVEEGIARPEAVDQALTVGLGLRWAAVGPFRLMDLGGLATFHAIASYLYRDLSAARDPQRSLSEKVAAGDTGLRAGRGFYEYAPADAHAAVAVRDARLLEFLKLLQSPAYSLGERPTASPEGTDAASR
jgi:3-hydroxyacyl-CoA dehydrogenase